MNLSIHNRRPGNCGDPSLASCGSHRAGACDGEGVALTFVMVSRGWISFAIRAWGSSFGPQCAPATGDFFSVLDWKRTQRVSAFSSAGAKATATFPWGSRASLERCESAFVAALVSQERGCLAVLWRRALAHPYAGSQAQGLSGDRSFRHQIEPRRETSGP